MNIVIEDKPRSKKKEYTMIDDPKPANEIIDDITFDIETVIGWINTINKDLPNDIRSLIGRVKCNNTFHGLQIMKKISMINGLVLSDEFMLGVILHDVVKYKKKRKAIVSGIFDRYIGPGRWITVGDHGVDGGYLLSTMFNKCNTRKFGFVYMHAKDRPYQTDGRGWSDEEIAFFVIDDLIRDINKYKTKLPKDQYDKVRQYYQHPTKEMTRMVFNILRDYHQSKDN